MSTQVAAALIVGTVILYLMRRRRAKALEAEPEPCLLEEEQPSLSPDVLNKQRLREYRGMARVNPATMAIS